MTEFISIGIAPPELSTTGQATITRPPLVVVA
jgi:hypothetical protein